VLVNDEEATLKKLNKICGVNHHLSSGNNIPNRRFPMHVNEEERIAKQVEGANVRNKTRETMLDSGANKKFFYIS